MFWAEVPISVVKAEPPSVVCTVVVDGICVAVTVDISVVASFELLDTRSAVFGVVSSLVVVGSSVVKLVAFDLLVEATTVKLNVAVTS